jgi:EmrB/QacA subfamily drug resistance transporter
MSDSGNLRTDDGKPTPPSSSETTAARPESFHHLNRRQVFITLGGVMLAMFLSSLDQTIVGTALPRIIADLKGFEHYTWVATAYLVTSTAMMPIVGRLTDMYGRKWFYIVGIVIFLIGSALCGLSQNMTQLILFRGFQGIGAGVMMTNAFIVIGDLFPPSERGKYQGLTMAVFGLSAIIGPLLGGSITDNPHLGWHWIFYINLPLGILVIAAFILFFPDIQPVRVKHQIDYLGIAALVLSVVPLIMGLSWGGVYDWSSPHVIGSLAVSAVMVVLFLVIEARAREPIMPLYIFRSQVVVISVVARFCIGMGMFGVIIFIPLFFQFILGQSATNSGIVLMPTMLGMVVGSTLSGQAVSRLGGHYRIQAVIGLAILALGMYLMSRMTLETTYARAVVNTAVTGVGMGIAMPLFVIAVQNAVPYRIMGVATSSLQFFQSIGQAVGLAVFGSIMANRFASNLTGNEFILSLHLPQDTLSTLAKNPEALVDKSAMEQLQGVFSQFGEQGPALAQQFVTVLKTSLATAITDVFVIGTGVIVAALVVTLFLKEVPLRKSHEPTFSE